ncbi:ABC transporter ATP-binding protein [Roseixanthobacter pseudopolyaromaticivorans]|uniref:ABC transporter ATP-binding protein n=1 Tax=Xanthobacteraceae TaxID=335928 RepID=UPI003727D614
MRDEAPILQVQDLARHYAMRGSAAVKAVDGVSFDIAIGETLALVGESGCGKSTLARMIMALDKPTGGKVQFQGTDLSRLSARHLNRLRRKFQIIFQDPYSSLNPRMTVNETLAEPLRLHRIVPADAVAGRVAKLLECVGLTTAQGGRYPHEFSGGQRQRIGIARALACEPQLIVCDEPVSALDVSVRAQVLNLLQDLQNQFGFSYLFISHDLSVVRHISHRVAVMYLGRLVEIGPTENVFERPLHPYTQALLSAIPVADPDVPRSRIALRGELPNPTAQLSGCKFAPRCAYADSLCVAEVPALEDSGGPTTSAVACHHWSELAVFDRGLKQEREMPAYMADIIARMSPRPA